jgi:hypothetical protein
MRAGLIVVGRISEMASPDLVQTLQNAVDGIVAAAKIRNVN